MAARIALRIKPFTLRPDRLVIELRGNGRTVSTVELSSNNNWTAEVTDLPIRDAEGNDIEYVWHEKEVLSYVLTATTINDEKVEKVNDKIHNAVLDQFKDAEETLDSAKAQLEDTLAETKGKEEE